jgi:hypothetical protein
MVEHSPLYVNDWKNIDHTQIYSIVWRVLYGAKSATDTGHIALNVPR